jgi:hypothetical protein
MTALGGVTVEWLQVELVQGAMDVNLNIEVVLNASMDGASMDGASIVDVNDDCGDGDCSMGSMCSSGATRGRVVDGY